MEGKKRRLTEVVVATEGPQKPLGGPPKGNEALGGPSRPPELLPLLEEMRGERERRARWCGGR